MTITGKGKYTGSKSVIITVTDKKLLSAVIVKVNKVDYTGEPITQGVVKSVKDGSTPLTEGVDYTISYENNINSGKDIIVLKALDSSNYDGEKRVLFDIKGISMSKTKVSGIVAKEFNGVGNVEQNLNAISIIYSNKGVNKDLIYDKDYTISYENNDKAGTASIIFTGKGLYNGTLKKNFKINKVKLEKVALDNSDIIVKMNKAGAKPDVMLSYNGVTLKNGIDYTLTYSNNKTISDTKIPTIKIKGKGSYTGNLTKTFTIIRKDITDETIAISLPDVKFKTNRGSYTTKLKIFDNGVALKLNKDYKVTFKKTQINGLPEEGYTIDNVVIEGIGNYQGIRTETFRIVNKLLTDSKIKASVIGEYYFIGQPVTLDKSQIVVKDNGNPLAISEYEIVEYKNNHKSGTAKVVIRGLGKYGGEKIISFKIKK